MREKKVNEIIKNDLIQNDDILFFISSRWNVQCGYMYIPNTHIYFQDLRLSTRLLLFWLYVTSTYNNIFLLISSAKLMFKKKL